MSKRPVALTVLCIAGAAASLYAGLLLLVGGVWLVPPSLGQRAAALAGLVIALASLYGLWRMRRWGLILLGVALLVRVAYAVACGQRWLTPALVGPVLVLLVGLMYVRRMA